VTDAVQWSSYWCAADVDLFGAKPFTVPTTHSPPTGPAGGDVFGMPVFSPLSPVSPSDQEMIDMQVLYSAVCVCVCILCIGKVGCGQSLTNHVCASVCVCVYVFLVSTLSFKPTDRSLTLIFCVCICILTIRHMELKFKIIV